MVWRGCLVLDSYDEVIWRGCLVDSYGDGCLVLDSYDEWYGEDVLF